MSMMVDTASSSAINFIEGWVCFAVEVHSVLSIIWLTQDRVKDDLGVSFRVLVRMEQKYESLGWSLQFPQKCRALYNQTTSFKFRFWFSFYIIHEIRSVRLNTCDGS